MELSNEQIQKLIEAGKTEEEAQAIAKKVELLDESETASGFSFWAGYEKVRLYWNHPSNKNRKGFVDLINGTIQADMNSMYRALHVINEKADFEVK